MDEWPEKGDKLFTSEPESEYDAHIYLRGNSWFQYVVGYKQSGDILIKHAIDTTRNYDYVVLPAPFLYRQYIELRLKQLIRDGNNLLDQPPTFPPTHNLCKLWQAWRDIYIKLLSIDSTNVASSLESEDTLAVEGCIYQFSSIDPTSEAFRYPVDKQGVTLLAESARVINLSNLEVIMNKIANYLEGCQTAVTVYLDDKMGFESYYAELQRSWFEDDSHL